MNVPSRREPAAPLADAAPARPPSFGGPSQDTGAGEPLDSADHALPAAPPGYERQDEVGEFPPLPRAPLHPPPPGYKLLDAVGEGGMGIVYRARDTGLDRDVAVKLLRDAFPADSAAARRFLDEARITGQLQHPGIPPVHQAGILPGGRPFLAMKLIRGRTLDDLLRERPDPAADRGRFVAVFEQVCQAVAYAHANGVIHRDLKPANVMVGAFGEVQVMDWGLAKVLESADDPGIEPEASGSGSDAGAADPDRTTDWRAREDGSATRAGSVLGTPAYMPPEQARGEIDRLDARADVFGLGAVLCTILTGRPPFAAADGGAVLELAAAGNLGDALARLTACGAEPDLVGLCRRCLAADPAGRPADGGEVATAVAGLRAAAEARARRAELDRVRAEGERAKAEAEAREQRKRRRAQVALAVSVLVVLGLAGGGAWYVDRQDAAARQDRAVHGEQVRLGVEQALARLPELHRLGLWQQADRSLTEAEQLLGPDADPALVAAVAAARRDTEFIGRLDQIRLEKIQIGGTGTKWEGVLPKYAAAFAAYGFDFPTGDPVMLANAVRESPVREYLLAALDDWALTWDRPDAERLFALTAAVTGHEWRRELLDAVRSGPKLAALFDRIPTDQRGPALSVALSYHLEKLGQDGLRRIEDGLRWYPGDMWHHYYRGAICYQRWSRTNVNNFDDPNIQRAGEAFRAALAVRPGTPAILRQFAMCVYWRNLPQAEAALEDAIRLAPQYALAHHTMANLLRNVNPARALAAAREAVRLDPNLGAAHKELGLLLRINGDLAGAEDALREAVRLGPNERFHQGDLGMVLVDRGKHAEAVGPLRAALRIDPRLTYAREHLGTALRAVNDPDGAIAAYREAIPLNPKDPWPHNRIGDTRREQGDFDGAAADYWEAIRLNPKDSHAHHHLGNCHRAKGDVAGAVAAARAALRLDPAAAYAHHNLGDAFVHSQDWAGAAAAFRRAIALDAKYAWSHANLGLALRHLGDLDGAATACRQAIRLDSALAAPRSELAEVERWHGYQKRLPGLLAGTDRPGSPAEALEIAHFCQQAFNRYYRLAFDLHYEAYFAAPDQVVPWQQYRAACAAVQLAAGNDRSAAIGVDEWYGLHALARRWLTADLSAHRGYSVSAEPQTRQLAVGVLPVWQHDPALAPVRDPNLRAGMPADERKAWEAFWTDVESILTTAGGTAPKAKP